MLSEWAAMTRDRDRRVRVAIAAGMSKFRVHELTGLGRATIDRTLAARTGPGGAINVASMWHLGPVMITDVKQGPRGDGAKSLFQSGGGSGI